MKLSFSDMLDEVKRSGRLTDAKVLESMEEMEEMFCDLEKSNPEKFHELMRRQHCIFYGPHYGEEFARHDVAKMRSKEATGKECEGEHWGVGETSEMVKAMAVPSSYNKWDVYVALNAFWHDVHAVQNDEEQIVAEAVSFFLKDMDGPEGKVWIYMEAMHAARMKQAKK